MSVCRHSLCLRALLRAPKHTMPGSCLQPFGYGTEKEDKSKQVSFWDRVSTLLDVFSSQKVVPYHSSMQETKEGESYGLRFKDRSNCLVPLYHRLLLASALGGSWGKACLAALWEVLQLLSFLRSIHLLCKMQFLLRARCPTSEDLALYFCPSLAEQCTLPYFLSQVNSRFYPRAVHR